MTEKNDGKVIWGGVLTVLSSLTLFLSYLSGFELELPLFVTVFYFTIPITCFFLFTFLKALRKSPSSGISFFITFAGISILIVLFDYILTSNTLNKGFDIKKLLVAIWFVLIALYATVRSKR